jgi:hypothetical protein
MPNPRILYGPLGTTALHVRPGPHQAHLSTLVLLTLTPAFTPFVPALDMHTEVQQVEDHDRACAQPHGAQPSHLPQLHALPPPRHALGR